ncbi:ADC synthase [Blastocladiella britannica]|nr:ADC synthase [Blastocladiella britannica]
MPRAMDTSPTPPLPTDARRWPLRVLLIDNFDSYTFNVYQLFCQVLTMPPIVIRNNQMPWDALRDNMLPQIDAIVLSPGPGSPERPEDFGLCASVLAHASHIPTFGVCLGHQGIAAHFGASVIRAPEAVHGRVCRMEHTEDSIFQGVPSPCDIVRYHSLIVDEASLPECLVPIAWASDATCHGHRLVMALRHTSLPLYGIQGHPESISSAYGRVIASNFCQLALQHLQTPPNWPRWSQLARVHCVVPAAEPEATEVAPSSVTPTVTPPYLPHVTVLEHGWRDPEAVFDATVAGKPFAVWLDSARVQGSTRWSYMGSLSDTGFVLNYSVATRTVVRTTLGKDSTSHTRLKPGTTFFDYLQALPEQYTSVSILPAMHGDGAADLVHGDLPPFLGGLVGYFGYEMKAETLPGLEHHVHPPKSQNQQDQPDAHLVFLDRIVCFDHVAQRVLLVWLEKHDPATTATASPQQSTLWMEQMTRALAPISAVDPRTTSSAPTIPANALAQHFVPDMDRAEYQRAIAASLAEIQAGETYEVCLTTSFRARAEHRHVDPEALYKTLRRTNPAPYAAYLDLGSHGWVACSSPERFVAVAGSLGRHEAGASNGVVQEDAPRTVTMKPIKGTARRGATPEDDAWIVAALAGSVKDRAENLMIVDLIRNDLALIARRESVVVPKLMAIESYETVHQMVTTVQASLHPHLTAMDVLRNTFPPGSMTGAPKLRTVDLLHTRFEQGRARGVYSGCIGFLSYGTGAAHLNVVIRTVVGDRNGRSMSIGAGGAIVALSDPDEEWDEVLVKCASAAGGVAAYLAKLQSN